MKCPPEGFEIHLNHLNLVSHVQLLEVFPGLFDRLAGYKSPVLWVKRKIPTTAIHRMNRARQQIRWR